MKKIAILSWNTDKTKNDLLTITNTNTKELSLDNLHKKVGYKTNTNFQKVGIYRHTDYHLHLYGKIIGQTRFINKHIVPLLSSPDVYGQIILIATATDVDDDNDLRSTISITPEIEKSIRTLLFADQPNIESTPFSDPVKAESEPENISESITKIAITESKEEEKNTDVMFQLIDANKTDIKNNYRFPTFVYNTNDILEKEEYTI